MIILVAFIIFIVAIFYFFRTPSRSQSDIDLESLMRQGTAPVPVDEALNKSEIEILMRQGTAPSPTPTEPKDNLTAEQKNELLKLMSAPRN